MWPVLLLLALGAPSPEVLAAHAELDAVAARIEQLKARHAAGDDVARELHRLLVRAQELSHVIERASARPPRPILLVPSPEELRERADAGRDEADRLAALLTALDARIAETRRAAPAPAAPARPRPDEATFASVGGPGRAAAQPQPTPQLRALVAHRAMLAERLVAVQAEIARLEAEAKRLESAP
jgi:hypothetical protein